MKCTKWSFAVIYALLAVPLFLSTGRLSTLAAAHTAKQQCINTCRARYRDCLHLKQLSTWECRGVYRDCTRYHCTRTRMTHIKLAALRSPVMNGTVILSCFLYTPLYSVKSTPKSKQHQENDEHLNGTLSPTPL